jgi:transposase
LRARLIGSCRAWRTSRITGRELLAELHDRNVRHATRAAGAKLFHLPPYSPDLNPIEQAFSQLKTLLRKENARAVEPTITCIGKLLEKVTPQASANYFKQAGYST